MVPAAPNDDGGAVAEAGRYRVAVEADQIEVRVDLDAGVVDADTLAEYAGLLAEQLGELDVDEVRGATGGEAPPGSKGLELHVLGALLVKLARSTEILGQIVDTLREWVGRIGAKCVRLEIDGDVLEITGASSDERRALIEAWVQRHAGQ
jgi:hypothetical protein